MIRLFHVSDLHFGAEDKAALDWFANIARDEAPDAVIMTGDLTMRARSAEFAAAAEWLAALGPPVTIEPGNHDLPYFNPIARFLDPYRRMRRIERMIERPLELKGVAIVPLKTTARAQWRWVGNWSKGHVAPRALAEALALVEAAPAGDVILVAAHHPLVEPGTRSSARTRGGAGALAALATAGAHAVLSGHVHDPFDIAHEAGGRTVRMIGAGTLSERVRVSRPSFNELRIDGGAIEVTARTMDAADPSGPGDRIPIDREAVVE